MRKLIAACAMVLIVGCEPNAKLTWDECMKSTDCKSATEEAEQANRTVHLACPANSNETNPLCDSAMATMDTAEQRACERLAKDDCWNFAQSLIATR